MSKKQGRGRPVNESYEAEQWLRSYMSDGDKPAITQKIFREQISTNVKFGWTTLRTIKRRLNVKSKPKGYGAGRWYWSTKTAGPVVPAKWVPESTNQQLLSEVQKLGTQIKNLDSKPAQAKPRPVWEDAEALDHLIESGTSEQLRYASYEIHKHPDWSDHDEMIDADAKLQTRLNELVRTVTEDSE